MASVVVNVEVIVKRGNRYLTIVRSDDEDFGGGWLCFPGGKLDPGTSGMHALEDTARRELMEEVGLDAPVESFNYIENHTFLIGEITVLDVVLLTESATGEPSAIDPAEVADLLWLTADEIMTDARVQEFTRESLRLAIARCASAP